MAKSVTQPVGSGDGGAIVIADQGTTGVKQKLSMVLCPS